jgi:hypothetical protein
VAILKFGSTTKTPNLIQDLIRNIPIKSPFKWYCLAVLKKGSILTVVVKVIIFY